MVIIRMSGGLGNQMFQYALYRKLRSLGREVKFDDISEYRGEKTRPIMLAVFGLTYPRASWNEIISFTDRSTRILQRIRRSLFGRRAVEYRENGIYDEKILEFESMYIIGAFQSEKYFADIKDEIRRIYRFPVLETMHLPEKLYTVTRDYLREMEDCASVGIHMYRSDSRNEVELYDGICTSEYYEGAVRFILDKVPDAKFFIFSNEPKWVKSWVQNLIRLQITEGMSRQEAKAMRERFVMVEANNEYTGYLDMMLMSKCRHNVISNSSFSWWSAWLNENPNKLIVVPSQWKNAAEEGLALPDCSDIYTENMVLVNARGRVEKTFRR